jgi:NUMOD3 motif/HNH endonuclease
MKKGHITTEKERVNKRLGQLGRKHSEESKLKRSLKLKGKSNGRVGTKHSLETRLKISKSHKDRVIKGISHVWKGGVTKENLKIRSSQEYRLWREAVFKRDNYTCIWCGDDRGGNLNADHIKSFALFPELRFAIDNGRTLCEGCHRKTESYGRSHLFRINKQK